MNYCICFPAHWGTTWSGHEIWIDDKWLVAPGSVTYSGSNKSKKFRTETSARNFMKKHFSNQVENKNWVVGYC